MEYIIPRGYSPRKEAMIEGKYEGINPIEKLQPDEPYFLLRAQDALAPEAVRQYADLLDMVGENLQAREVRRFAAKMANYQRDHGKKIPD